MGYIFHKDKVLLVHHNKEDRFMSCGGHVEVGESLVDALKREIKEELNLDISLFNESPFISLTKKKGDGLIEIHEFLCFADNLNDLSVRKSELSSYRFFSKNDVTTDTVLQPQVKSILLRAFDHLGI